MAETLVPDHVDARKIFSKGATISGTLPVARLERLPQLLSDNSGSVQVDLSFSTDEQRRRVVAGTVSTQVNAVCQRCLEAVAIELQDTVSLIIVETEEHIRRLPKEYDPWMCTEDVIDVLDLIEEQLLLCMPLVNYHREGECTGAAASIITTGFSAASSTAPEPDSAGPFAILQKLKQQDKD